MKKQYLFLFLFLSVFMSGYVYADFKPDTGSSKTASLSAQQQKAQRCTKVTAQINKEISKYNADADHPRLQKMAKELAVTIAKLKAKGYDTSTIEADLTTLGTKINSCRSAFSVFITKLGATKSLACGASQGQFAAALKAAETEHKTNVVPACQDARKYLEGTVRTDLQSLRQQIVKPTKTPKPTRPPKATKATTPISTTQ